MVEAVKGSSKPRLAHRLSRVQLHPQRGRLEGSLYIISLSFYISLSLYIYIYICICMHFEAVT